MSLKKMLFLLLSSTLMFGCVSEKKVEEKIVKVLKEKPEVLVDAIKDNPAEIVKAIQSAAKEAQKAQMKDRAAAQEKELEKYLEEPLEPKIREDEAIRGPADAPITLVEYSDFECPYCKKGYQTVQALMEKYDGKIRFIYKHLPLSFHKKAEISAKYFEALRLQSDEMAFEYHDKLFENQQKLQNGESFLKKIAKDVGADMDQLEKDLNSEKVKKRLSEDQEEAAKYGMKGTPGFIINGVPVRGAYPPKKFVSIINKLEESGKLTL